VPAACLLQQANIKKYTPLSLFRTILGEQKALRGLPEGEMISTFMAVGQTYICQNRSCSCEVKVLKDSANGRSNPRCRCGTEMKKLYVEPVLRELAPKALVSQKADAD
jgi:hypothetical protein